MNNQANKVATVNELARQLLHVEHPNSDEILQRQNKLNARYAWKLTAHGLLLHHQ